MLSADGRDREIAAVSFSVKYSVSSRNLFILSILFVQLGKYFVSLRRRRITGNVRTTRERIGNQRDAMRFRGRLFHFHLMAALSFFYHDGHF